MRVALTMTAASDTGGVERQAHSVARALIEAGHEVHVFAQRRDASVDPRIRFHRIPKPVRVVPAARVWLFDRLCEREVRRAGPFDVVHGFAKTSRQDVYYDGSGCLADFQRYSIDSLPHAWRRTWRRASLHQRVVARIERTRYTRGNFRRILAISELVRGQILRRYGLSREEVETLYPGVDLERFRPVDAAQRSALRAELAVPGDAPLLVFLGSDYRRKGLPAFLGALARLPGAHGLVIGRERPARQRGYARQAEALGVRARTHFLGIRPEPGRYLAGSDCLVFPTHFDAFGSAVLEALACGTPAVVSARAGAAELVADGKAGAVVADPQDAEALARAARPFLEPGRRAEAARLARQEAERHPWRRHTDRVLAIYEELAAETGG
jgi:UDP-glucose:(heptosyl)LPS alpha-1,3-glucosyltransferase